MSQQTLKGQKVRAVRRITSRASIIEAGEVAIITRHRRDGTFDLHKPVARITGVEREAFKVLRADPTSGDPHG